jgi:toxin-antitoxin system PIN domain toxin
MTPDVNVLVAAYRPEHPHHRGAHEWLTTALEECARGGTVELLPMVAAGFVRIVTNGKAFRVPDMPSDALAFIRRILAVPGAAMLSAGPEWSVFEKLCLDLDVSGNDVADAWIAAAVKANGLRLVTFDRDFARLLDPAECLLLEPRRGVQERRASYLVRRMPRFAAIGAA